MASGDGMVFKRYGRSYHLGIRTAEDLRRVPELDEAHWVATGAPVSSINCDAVLLSLIDTDDNGRIMCFELSGAIQWLFATLTDAGGVTAGSRVLQLETVNTDTPDGRAILESSRKMLARLGRPEDDTISLDQVRQIKREVEATPVSEAGIVLPEAAPDDDTKQFISDIISSVGGAEHPSGRPGVSQQKMDEFLTAAQAHLEWRAQGEPAPDAAATEVMPLGEGTPAAFAALQAVRPKADQYFAQCEAVAYDERVADRIGLTEQELAQLDFDDSAVIEKVLAESPLTRPRADRTLRFSDPINSRYADALEDFRTKVAEPILGEPQTELTQAEWRRVKARFAAHEAWATNKGGARVEPLGPARLRACLDGPCAEKVRGLIAQRVSTAFVLDNIRLTEKAILYQAYLLSLANNFVSFPDLYDIDQRAMFEKGTLVMDGRQFNLAVLVEKRPAHVGVAKNSQMFVLYVEIMSKAGQAQYEVALPVTSGGKGNLCPGKRGIFRDLSGAEWDARVTQIIENPISVCEALVSPFKRIAAVITGKIESLTTQAEKKLDKVAASVVTQPKQAAPAAKGSQAMMAGGMLVGGSVAIAALASAAAYITKTLAALKWWQILIGVGCAVLAVMLPTSIVAFLKLRRRDLSSILEASGWAINGRMRLTHRQGRFFARRPEYPKGSRDRAWRRRWLIPLIVIAALVAGGWVISRLRGRGAPPTSGPAPRSADKGR